NGGVISGETAAREAVRTILSGPAGGVVGGFEVASAAGFRNAITFDMGGTSTDVSLIDETIGFTGETEVAGCPIRVPVIDIHTVGAGGGSIARCDPGGALEVGPESAGADPGPICYGRGTEVTVTDANLFLGRLDPDRFLGGRMRLKIKSVKKGIEKLAASLNLSPIQTAEGVLRVADQHMARAIRLISVERGHDPREYVLVSFGGAGAMHACSLARILDIPTVLIPRDPGILSARGMVVADVVRDYAQTVLQPAEAVNGKKLENYFRPLLDRATKDLRKEGFSSIRVERFADMRYFGQSFEIMVSIPKGGNPSGKLLSRFHEMHDSRFGVSNPQRPVEVVTLRVRAVGKVKKPPPSKIAGGKTKTEAIMGTHPIIFGGKVYK
ncbi:MAG: hydantoinase/oxoprolinase family protein, partial [Nitrospinota bacterium]|nr:hydantoinase/oxoprolinase family protein [Nitrospinota bacterium]